jgi:predicted ArsR family transcriptional regulator
LLDNVESYEELEVVLYFAATGAADAASAARDLRIPVEAVLPALEALTARGLLSSDGLPPPAFRYDPKSAELERGVRDLTAAYRLDRIRIIELMAANAMARLRSAALKTFADCFRLGRSKKDG